MRCALQTGQQEEAQLAANELLKDPKLSPEVEAEARYIRAKAYINHKQPAKAVEDLTILSKDTRTVHGAEAKYLLAQYFYDTNDDKNAEKILEDFARTARLTSTGWHAGFILWAVFISRPGRRPSGTVLI